MHLLSHDAHCRVMITAVDGRDTKLELRFFNNCFSDAFSDGMQNTDMYK